MATNKTKPTEEVLAHLSLRQVVITSLITAISTIIITLISTGHFKPEEKKEILNNLPGGESTFVHTDPVKAKFWSDAADYFIWFNAQYRNATTVHDKKHYVNIIKNEIKYALYVIQPDKGSKNDFRNFEEKFKDMRTFIRKINNFGIEDNYDMTRKLPLIFSKIYLFKEEKTPSISFFITLDSSKHQKAIFYIEEKGYFIDENRKPIVCIETKEQSLINKFESRYKDLENKIGPENKLDLNKLLSNVPDSTFFLK